MSEPITRVEKYIAYAAGEWNGDIPTPVTRIEQYLYDLCISGGGGRTQEQSDWEQTDTEAVDFIKNKPTLGTASTKDVAATGNASATQVVMGNDSRLNNSISSTSTTSPLTDSADGYVQNIIVKGKSRKSKNLFSGLRVGVSINANDGSFGTWNVAASSDYIPMKSGYYTVSGLIPDLMTLICFYDTNKQKTNLITTVDKTKTLYNDGSYVYIAISQYQSENIANLVASAKIQLEEGSTATDYESYFSGIKSIGDDGLTITTTNIDNTLTTSAEFTTALPLRGVSDTVRDKLICTADAKQVETVCGRVKLVDLMWSETSVASLFQAVVSDMYRVTIIDERNKHFLCSSYPPSTTLVIDPTMDDRSMLTNDKVIFVYDTNYTTVSDFVASLGDAELVYELATPVTTLLTTAEISAFRSLRTYDNTTNITITDEPEFELDYLKNSENGKAVAGIQRDLQAQIDALRG